MREDLRLRVMKIVERMDDVCIDLNIRISKDVHEIADLRDDLAQVMQKEVDAFDVLPERYKRDDVGMILRGEIFQINNILSDFKALQRKLEKLSRI